MGSTIDDMMWKREKTQDKEVLISEEEEVENIEYENKAAFHDASINNSSSENNADVW